MIITREAAEAARATLEAAPSLDDIDEAFVKSLFKMRAIEHHPDKGGDVAKFVAMDRAKHVLLHWIERRDREGQPKARLVAGKCPRCNGVGRITLHRGFKPYVVRCVSCNGTGDKDYEHDRARE